MVDGFTKDGTFRPIRSPVAPPSLTVRELLPKEQTKQEEERQSKRLGKFAKDRKEKEEEKEISKKKKLLTGGVKGAKALGRFTRFGAESIKQRRIEKSIEQGENIDRLDREIDDIIDDPNSSDARKFRLLVRLASNRQNKRFLTNDQRRFLDRTNRELAQRVREERKATPTALSVGGGGVGSGISGEQFAKLPQELREEVREQVV